MNEPAPAKCRRTVQAAAVALILIASMVGGQLSSPPTAGAAALPKILFGEGPEADVAAKTQLVTTTPVGMLSSWYNGPKDLTWVSGWRNTVIPNTYASGRAMHLIVWTNDPEKALTTAYGPACGRSYPLSDRFIGDMTTLAQSFAGAATGPPLYVTLFSEFQTFPCDDNAWAASPAATNYYRALKDQYLKALAVFHQYAPNSKVSLGWGGWQADYDSPSNGGGRSMIPYFADVMHASDFQSFQAMQSDSNVADIKAMTAALGSYGPVMLAHYQPNNNSHSTFDTDMRAILNDTVLTTLTSQGLFAISFMNDKILAADPSIEQFVASAVQRYAGGIPMAPVPPAVSVGGATVLEGDSGTTTVSIPVSLSWTSPNPVTVTYSTSASTAKAGSDFVAIAASQLTFAPFETNKTISVKVVGDLVHEPTETFSLRLTKATGATLADTMGTITVLDNDPLISVSVSDAAVLEGQAGNGNLLSFKVSLSSPPPAGQSVSVTAATKVGTATAGVDYTALGSTVVTFTAGQSSRVVTVPVLGDTTVEANETVTLGLSAPVGVVIADPTGVGTIVNDDGPGPAVWPLPTLAAGDATVLEGDSGTALVQVPVTLSAASTTPVTVTVATANSAAKAPADFVAVGATTLTFNPGETVKSVPVSVVGDRISEPTEAFSVKLSKPTGATLADASATVTVLDNDTVITVSVSDAWVYEANSGTGAMTFTVTLSTPAVGPVTMAVATADATATAGPDYSGLASTVLTFAAGEQSKTVSVLVNGDTTVEKYETFTLRVSAITGAVAGDPNGLGTIANDD